MNKVRDPPGVRRKRAKQRVERRKRRNFRKRYVLITVLQVAVAIVKLVQFIMSVFGGF